MNTLIIKINNKKNSNIFNLDIDIFDSLHTILSKKAYENFHKQFYSKLIVDFYFKEITATIAYKWLHDNDSLIPSFVNSSEYDIIKRYLMETAMEEKNHADLLQYQLEEFLEEHIDINYNDAKIYNEIISTLQNKSLAEILLTYYIGESSTLAYYNLMYKHTTNDTWKKILKNLMVDEVNHNKKILEILEILTIRNNLIDTQKLEKVFWDQSYDFLTLQMQSYYPEMLAGKYQFKSTFNTIVHEGFKSQFVQSYQFSLKKKLYKYIKLLNNTLSFEDFASKLDNVPQTI